MVIPSCILYLWLSCEKCDLIGSGCCLSKIITKLPFSHAWFTIYSRCGGDRDKHLLIALSFIHMRIAAGPRATCADFYKLKGCAAHTRGAISSLLYILYSHQRRVRGVCAFSIAMHGKISRFVNAPRADSFIHKSQSAPAARVIESENKPKTAAPPKKKLRMHRPPGLVKKSCKVSEWIGIGEALLWHREGTMWIWSCLRIAWHNNFLHLFDPCSL